jgi:anti-sigma B factor antagonist
VDVTQTRDGGETAGVENFLADDLLGVDVVASSRGTVLTVSPTGEIDSFTAPVLRSALLICLRPPCTHVIVDLDGLTFLGCAGLTVLAQAHHLAQADGIDLTVRGGHRAVLRPLQVTGLWKKLAPHPG